MFIYKQYNRIISNIVTYSIGQEQEKGTWDRAANIIFLNIPHKEVLIWKLYNCFTCSKIRRKKTIFSTNGTWKIPSSDLAKMLSLSLPQPYLLLSLDIWIQSTLLSPAQSFHAFENPMKVHLRHLTNFSSKPETPVLSTEPWAKEHKGLTTFFREQKISIVASTKPKSILWYTSLKYMTKQ